MILHPAKIFELHAGPYSESVSTMSTWNIWGHVFHSRHAIKSMNLFYSSQGIPATSQKRVRGANPQTGKPSKAQRNTSFSRVLGIIHRNHHLQQDTSWAWRFRLAQLTSPEESAFSAAGHHAPGFEGMAFRMEWPSMQK